MKYFPDKPYDVNCATCPYQQGGRCGRRATLMVINPPRAAMQIMTISESDYDWCGEHPWFAQERAYRDEMARIEARRS